MGSANPVAVNVPPVNVDAVGKKKKNPIKPPHGWINLNKAGAKREAITFTYMHYLALILRKRNAVSLKLETNDSNKVEKEYWMIFAGLRGRFLNNNSEPSPSQMHTSDACSCGFALAGKQDCRYESSNLSHTDDRWRPTYTSHRKKEENIPGV